MTVVITPAQVIQSNGQVRSGYLSEYLAKNGRLPPVTINIIPLDKSPVITVDTFLDYRFSSSVVIPVDTFSFSFVLPDDPIPTPKKVHEGDIVQVSANGQFIATGIIDTVDVETDMSFGEKVLITGRDLMGQLEDHDCVSILNDPIYGARLAIQDVVKLLNKNTRIQDTKIVVQDGPLNAYLFATEPGETKLTALHRYLEPLNCITWMSPDGSIIVGRPNMAQPPTGTWFLKKSSRESNVSDIKVSRASATIPNVMLPIWTGQENVQTRVAASQSFYNAASGPTRLRKLGHVLPRATVVSNPQGADPQDLALTNSLAVSAQQKPVPAIAGSSTILEAYAKRELARQNQKEIVVQVVIPGHYNFDGSPVVIDKTYQTIYDRGDVDEKMYAFQVEYSGSEASGQQTSIYLCRLGCIVSDVRAP